MKVIIFFSLLLLTTIYACDKPYVDCQYPDYSNCITHEPDSGKLKIKVTINEENSFLPITLYYSKSENNVICKVDTLYTSEKEYKLPAKTYYSVKAKYKSNNKIVYAVDGGNIGKKSYLVCDSTCWVVKDVDLNLKLNY